jgi:F0F1-type ATP synthase membrane subunit b/b'
MMSWNWQPFLMYLTLALALGYLLYKFVWPEVRKSKKPDSSGGCGSSDCGCR